MRYAGLIDPVRPVVAISDSAIEDVGFSIFANHRACSAPAAEVDRVTGSFWSALFPTALSSPQFGSARVAERTRGALSMFIPCHWEWQPFGFHYWAWI